jgi:uncharacterized membrane protein
MIVLALVIGIIAGLRAMVAPAAIAWAACCGRLALEGGWLAFMGWRFTPWIFSPLAAAELVTDQLPSTPSRKVPPQFGARIVSGGLCGAAIGFGQSALWVGLALGVVGAVIGKLAAAFGKDRPAALIEDVVAIGGAILVYAAL